MFAPHADRYAHFTFEHVQVAMKLFQKGLLSDANRFLKCVSVTRPQPDWISFRPYNYGFELFEALLIHGAIFVRAQIWIFVSDAQGYDLPNIFLPSICEHLDPNLQGEERLSPILQRNLTDLSVDELSCLHCSNLIRCRACCTEVHVGTRILKSDPNIKVVVTTKWQCLEDFSSPVVVPKNLGELELRPRRGVIRDAFERETRNPFNTILSTEKAWKSMRNDQ